MHFFDSSESVTQKSHHLDPIYMKSPFKFFKLMTGLLLPYFSLPKTDYSLDVLWQIFSIATLFKRIPMPLMIYPFNWGKYPGINILQINIAKISRSVLVSPAVWTFENWSEKKSFTNLCAYNILLLESVCTCCSSYWCCWTLSMVFLTLGRKNISNSPFLLPHPLKFALKSAFPKGLIYMWWILKDGAP